MRAVHSSVIVSTVFEQQPISLIENPAKDDALGKPSQSLHSTAAALASSIVPGVGHFMLGRWQTGFCLVACFAMLVVGFWPLRLLRCYGGFVGLYTAWVALFLYGTCSAQLTRNQQNARPSPWWLLGTIPVALVALSLSGAALTRASGFSSFEIPSTAMEPTIRRGDHIVVDCFSFRSRHPRRPEVIIFKKGDTFFVKRVIGVAGDTLEGNNKLVLVNGAVLSEDYIQHTAPIFPGDEWMDTFGTTKVPVGKYFVTGDNRDVSLDSRSPDFGLVDESSIVGKAMYVFRSGREGTNIR